MAAVAAREPHSQPRHPHDRRHPGPVGAQPWARLLRPQDRRRQDSKGSPARAQTPHQRRPLGCHGRRRPTPGGPNIGVSAENGLGRATGERLCRQRGRLTPRYTGSSAKPLPNPTEGYDHQASPTSRNSTVSPFENLAPAWRPLITISRTVVPANDFRNCHEAGVQFPMLRCRSQLIRSQAGGVMYVHVPGAAQRRSPPAKSGAHVLPTRSISCLAESLGPVADVDASGSASFSIDVVGLVSTV